MKAKLYLNYKWANKKYKKYKEKYNPNRIERLYNVKGQVCAWIVWYLK